MRTPKPWILPTLPTPRAVLTASGVTPEMIATQLAAGRLHRLRHGVYVAAASQPPDPAGQHLMLARAEQTAIPDSVLSHHTAALVWGLPTPGFREWWEEPPSLTLPTGSDHRQRGGCTLRTASLRPGDVTRDALGYPVTSLARTAIDLAAGLPLPQALVILDAAGRLHIEGLLRRPRHPDYANPRLVRSVRESLLVAAPDRSVKKLLPIVEKVEPCRESPAESLTAGHLYLSGLPMPVFQAPIHSPMGTLYPDCYWSAHRLVGECDGASKYTDQSIMVAEKQREQWFRDERYPMVRWLGKEIVGRPATVMTRIAIALGE